MIIYQVAIALSHFSPPECPFQDIEDSAGDFEKEGSRWHEATTDEDGTHLLTGMPGGEYKIGIGSGEYRFSGPWPTVYYPNARKESEAEPHPTSREARIVSCKLQRWC